MTTIPTAVFSEAPRLLDFFAENPGVWGNARGIKLTKVDTGTKQQSSLVITGTWTADTSVVAAFSYDGATTTITQPFVTTLADSLQSFADKLKTWLGQWGAATVEVRTPQFSNQQFIFIQAPIAGKDLALTGWSIAGAAALRVLYTVSTAGVLSTGRFNVELYSSASTNVPIDIFVCSLRRETDVNGISMYVEDVINTRSKDLRVFVNGDPNTLQLSADTSITWLAGGDDGVLPSSADIINGWDTFASAETSTIRTAISGGYATPDVARKIVSICENRKDCSAILETPLSVQTAEEAVEYREVSLGIDSNRAALYAPGVWITDNETGSKIMCPISGIIASNYARIDKDYGDQYAPAGYNRAVITSGEPTQLYLEPDRDILGPAQINYVGRHNLRLPWSIMDEKTLTRKNSWFSWVHVRRTITRMQINITDALYYQLWNFIEEDDLQRLQDLAQAYGDQMVVDKRAQKVRAHAYSTPTEQILGTAFLDMRVVPVGVMREIKFTSILHGTVAQFDESEI